MTRKARNISDYSKEFNVSAHVQMILNTMMIRQCIGGGTASSDSISFLSMDASNGSD